MHRVLSNGQMRAADRYTIETLKIPSETLMRAAGEAIADEVIRICAKKSVLVVCGTGNNGGDGFVCAQKLQKCGVNVSVFALSGKLSEDCARERLNYGGAYSDGICGDIIVDCIFGTGLSREVSGEYAQIIEKINSSGAFVISADIPSGLNGDNGRIMGCAVKADVTVCIAELKLGHVLSDGPDFCGKIKIADIGIKCPDGNYAEIYDDKDVSAYFPLRRRNSHKGTYGSANIIAGSDKYPGAAALATRSALKSGCGYVKLTTSERVKFALAPRIPQAVYSDDADLSSQALAIGSGCGVSSELYEKLQYILTNYSGKLIIDADGLNTLSKYGAGVLDGKKCAALITPHIKEFSRLTGLSTEEILSNPVKCARDYSEAHGVCVLLKSNSSVICEGDRTVINVRGDTSLSKGGSGDILTGFICGLAARGLPLFDAAVCASYTLGLAAEISSEEKTEYCATAEDIIKNLHFSVKRLTCKNQSAKM